MSQKGFILNKVLWGIFLGLAVVAGWLFYPNISTLFESAAPRISDKIAAVKEEVMSRESPFATEKDEPASTENLINKEKEIDATLKDVLRENDETAVSTKVIVHKPLSQEETGREAIKPYYAEEESLWQDLLKKPLNPEYIDNYPYGECFKRASTGNSLPLPLILGLARYLSYFAPASSMDNRSGIMRLGWPNPARRMGVQKKEEIIEDPCRNIELACRFLSDLLSRSGGEWVPALVAFRDQVEAVHPEKVKKGDLLFSSRLRKHVQEVIKNPFEKKTMYTFWKFDERMTAEEFVESIEKRSGVDLWLGQENRRYVVFIPAANEGEKRKKADMIKKETGIAGR